jgi:hypothetical protein
MEHLLKTKLIKLDSKSNGYESLESDLPGRGRKPGEGMIAGDGLQRKKALQSGLQTLTRGPMKNGPEGFPFNGRKKGETK